MPLTVRVQVNGTDVEVLHVRNVGEVPGDRTLHRYAWRSDDGGSGTVLHHRRTEGAADLAARVLADLTAKRRGRRPQPGWPPTRVYLPPSRSGDRTL